MAKKCMPRNHLSDAHKWTTIQVLQKRLPICTHTVVITILKAWAVKAELQYSGKDLAKLQRIFIKHLFVSMSVRQNLFVSVFVHECMMMLNDVEYIQHSKCLSRK